MERAIYHIPWDIKKGRLSATGIRPLEMLKAFKDIGLKVDVVMGPGRTRNNAIKKIKRNIENGIIYSFLYSESSVAPTFIASGWQDYLKYGNIDLKFIKLCHKKGIKTSLFYRDIHWKFPELRTGLPLYKKVIFDIAHRLDLWFYNKYIDHLYLPSMRMKYLVEGKHKKIGELPPGTVYNPKSKGDISSDLKLFYVGGLGELYQLQTFFKVVSNFEGVHFDFCTREDAWNENKAEYSKYITDHISVFHKSSNDLVGHIMESDVGILFLKPHKYMSLAMPVKMFEYLSYELPIIATEGTAAGDWVRDNGAGWVIPYEENSLKFLLDDLVKNPQKIRGVKKTLEVLKVDNLWKCRADKVAKDFK